MKRLMRITVGLMIMMTVPMMTMAMSHEKHEGHDHGKSEEMMHKGHEMEGHGDMAHDDHGQHKGHDMHSGHDEHSGHGGMAVIDEVTVKGVKGTAKIMVYDAAARAAMAKGGQEATHHMMVYFTDAGTGKEITTGKAAIKIKSHGGESRKPIGLMSMGGGFGADVNLPEGHYELEDGTKLEDGKKRTFDYHYMAK